MSKPKHNYTQYAKNNQSAETTEAVETIDAMQMSVVEDTVTTEQVAIHEVAETVEQTVTTPEIVTGIVVNCAKLNVREHPDITSEALCVLNATSELEISLNESTSEWFKVITATGVEGYCMRKFIDANL